MNQTFSNPNTAHYATNLMSWISSNDVLDAAFALVIKGREHDSHNSDVWDVRRQWPAIKSNIRQQLLAGSYQLSPLWVVGSQDGHRLTRWSTVDSIVLKAMAMVLTQVLSATIDRRCHHAKGHGGLKGAINIVHNHITASQQHGSAGYSFVVKSDIADFYASMAHDVLTSLCQKSIKDPRVIDILGQYMNRVEIYCGDHDLIEVGIAKGCPLSPLMGALMLKSLDKMIPQGCAYARYMDDWVILIQTRTQLRKIVKNMHGIVHGLGLKLALKKTFIGRIKKGFDFLGYRFDLNGLVGLAQKTIENHMNKLAQLYEQSASDQRVCEYKLNWLRWVRAGIVSWR